MRASQGAVAAVGVLLALGPVALIEVYRGLGGTATAATSPPGPPPAAAPKDDSRLPPAGAPPVLSDAGSLLFTPTGAVPQTFTRPAASRGPSPDRAGPPSSPVPSSDGAPARKHMATGRTGVTRSVSCDGKMPADAWLDICG